jgi:hypothetical protein
MRPETRARLRKDWRSHDQWRPWAPVGGWSLGSGSATSDSKRQDASSLDPYAVLGLDPKQAASYTMHDVRQAYRRMCLVWHPDRTGVWHRCHDHQLALMIIATCYD